jgi:arabinose-5-phosphate isomerase
VRRYRPTASSANRGNGKHPLEARTRARYLVEARAVIEAEGKAVLALLDRLDGGFTAAVDCILRCKGRVVVTGMGKSGIVGEKISATLASTGTPSLYLHAAEAVHGDLGRITHDDVVLALSYSGESEEIVRLVRPVKSFGATLVVMTGDADSRAAKHADVVIAIGHVTEACSMGMVPTASTTAMMVVGDALAMCLFEERGLDREDYARFHPGGLLGRQLMRVDEVMRRGDENPVAKHTAPLREVVRVMTKTKGRPGATSIVDGRGRLVGFFTDGDLRRLLENPGFTMSVTARDVMHPRPKAVRPDQLVVEAARILREHKIDQLPVVDERGRPVGFLDVQDILSTRI